MGSRRREDARVLRAGRRAGLVLVALAAAAVVIAFRFWGGSSSFARGCPFAASAASLPLSLKVSASSAAAEPLEPLRLPLNRRRLLLEPFAQNLFLFVAHLLADRFAQRGEILTDRLLRRVDVSRVARLLGGGEDRLRFFPRLCENGAQGDQLLVAGVHLKGDVRPHAPLHAFGHLLDAHDLEVGGNFALLPLLPLTLTLSLPLAAGALGEDGRAKSGETEAYAEKNEKV